MQPLTQHEIDQLNYAVKNGHMGEELAAELLANPNAARIYLDRTEQNQE